MYTLYQYVYEQFKSSVEDGLELQAHSGTNGPNAMTVNSIKDYYDHDETMCEDDWSSRCDDEGLPMIVTVEEILNGADLSEVVYNHLHDLFIKSADEQGNFGCEKFDSFFTSHLDDDDKDNFISWLQGEENELEILRYLIDKHAVF